MPDSEIHWFLSLQPEELIHMQCLLSGTHCSRDQIREWKENAIAKAAFSRGRDMGGCLADLGLTLLELDWAYDFPRFLYRAEIWQEKKEIRLFLPTLDEFAASLAFLGVDWAQRENLKRMLLAHELFHFLEPGQKGTPAEVQAHLFAQHLAGVPVYPWVLDILHMNYRHPGFARDCKKRYMELYACASRSGDIKSHGTKQESIRKIALMEASES